MNLERVAMMGKLAEAKQRFNRLCLKVEGNTKFIRQGINTLLTPPEELELPLLDEQWDELMDAGMELKVLREEIKRLKKELL